MQRGQGSVKTDQSSQDTLNLALANKAKAEKRKLALEGRQLEHQMRPRQRRLEVFKTVAAASGLVLVLVSVMGALGSVGAWFYNERQDRLAKIEERLERALINLSEESAQRRAGSLALLRSFVVDPDRSERVILAVTEALPLEDSAEVANGIIAFLSQLQGAPQTALNAGLHSLASKSRLIVISDARSDYLQQSRLITSGLAALIRSGARGDLSGVDLTKADLSGLDLRETSFKGSILVDTDFSFSTAPGVNFIDADLWNANFTGAKLSDTDFSQYIFGGGNTYVLDHLKMVSVAEGEVRLALPNFTCADLTNSVFRWQPLIVFDFGEAQVVGNAYPKFEAAILNGAKFEELRAVGINLEDGRELPFSPPPTTEPITIEMENRMKAAEVAVDPNVIRIDALTHLSAGAASPLADDFEALRNTFTKSQRTSGSFSTFMRDKLGNETRPSMTHEDCPTQRT